MHILEHNDMTLVLEFRHVDVSLVNALRRILLAEIPTMAIEHVFLFENTGIMKDEILSHRLGLIPLRADARLFQEAPEDPEDATDLNTLVFTMNVACKNNSNSDTATTNNTNTTHMEHAKDPDGLMDPNTDPGLQASMSSLPTTTSTTTSTTPGTTRPYTQHVYSQDLVWSPAGDQLEFAGQKIEPLHKDILITKLRPGQVIECEAHAVKGIGKDHAKFSPVATASYRLLPKITLLQNIYDQDADELVHLYEPGVFTIVPTTPTHQGGGDPPDKSRKVQIANPYACTMSRNYQRNPRLNQAIRMERVPDHFIFSIESLGAYPPEVLLAEALRVLQQKCQRVSDCVDSATSSNSLP